MFQEMSWNSFQVESLQRLSNPDVVFSYHNKTLYMSFLPPVGGSWAVRGHHRFLRCSKAGMEEYTRSIWPVAVCSWRPLEVYSYSSVSSSLCDREWLSVWEISGILHSSLAVCTSGPCHVFCCHARTTKHTLFSTILHLLCGMRHLPALTPFLFV